MTDPRIEHMDGYIKHEHANSYAVETAGLKDLVFGNKRSQSRQELTEAVPHLQDRVTSLIRDIDRNAVHSSTFEETTTKGFETAGKTIEGLYGQVQTLHKEVEYLQEQVRQQNKQYTNLYVQVHGQLTPKLQGFVKEQEALNLHTARAIDAIQKVVLRIPGLRVQN